MDGARTRRRRFQRALVVRLGLVAALSVATAPARGAAGPPAAGTPVVLILASSGHSAYQRALSSVRSALQSASPETRVLALTLAEREGDVAVREALAESPSVLVAIGSRAARLAQEGAAGVPLVYSMVLDPASVGLPAPGQASAGGATGISLDVPLEDQFRLIREILPEARRIGVLYDPAISGDAVRRAGTVAQSNRLLLIPQAVRSDSAALEAAALLAPSVDAMLAIADPTVLTASNTRPLILLWLRARKPLIAMSEGFVRNGALAALVPDPDEVGRRAGEFAARILQGTPISALRPEPPPRISIFLNSASAEHLGVDLPGAIVTRARTIFPER